MAIPDYQVATLLTITYTSDDGTALKINSASVDVQQGDLIALKVAEIGIVNTLQYWDAIMNSY